MTTPVWAPGTLYQPGSLVVPRSLSGQVQTPPDDPKFESGGLTHWTATAVGGSASGAISTTYFFDGANSFFWAGGSGSQQDGGIGCNLVNNFRAPVVPGQSITASCYVMSVPLHREHGVFGSVRLFWYGPSDELISVSSVAAYGDGGPGHGFGTTGQWVLSTVTGVAPPGAVTCSIGAFLLSNQGDENGSYADGFSWNYIAQTLPHGLVFRAIQPESGYSAANEPVWPVVVAATVYDNDVIWEAVDASRVVWEATPILVSAGSEPTFPNAPGGSVVDGTIVWVAMDSQVKDPKCPQSKEVAIAASKVFATDKDIIAYCATVNPLDWSTPKDAGYLPFGLQTYGGTPCKALGLYRGNLVAFNQAGYQMWQVDEDPANMALLDASPVGSRFHATVRPVANDLCFLTDQGIRNIGIAGASTNIQAGFFGKGIDPLVLQSIRDGDVPFGLFWPGTGQYWVFFGSRAYVLTMNGGPSDMSWSRYEFPEDVTDWTLHEGKLIVRAGTTKVWEFDDTIEGIDDYYCDLTDAPVLAGERDALSNDLSWTAVAGTDRYWLYANGVLVAKVSGLAYVHTDLDENTAYAYYVIAVPASGGASPHSNTVNLNVGGPAAPVLDGAIGTDITTADLTWTLPSTGGGPILGFKLYNADTNALIDTFPSPATLSDTQTGLANDTEYSYYIKAYTAQTDSAASNTIQLDTGHPHIIVDVYTSDAVWTKRALLVSIDVLGIGPGGGGSGGRGASPVLADGGGGGGGGGFFSFSLDGALVGDTEDVFVGTGGAGGIGGFDGDHAPGGTGGAGSGPAKFGLWGTANGGNGGPPYTGSGGSAAGGGSASIASSGPTSKVTEVGGAGAAKESPAPPGNTTHAGAGGGKGGLGVGGTCSNFPGGNGGDGGQSNEGGTGTPGVNGVSAGGGGGGGGASSQDPVTPPFHVGGAGGHGGDGIVIVTNYLS